MFIGVSFNTAEKDLKHQIPVALDVFARGVEAFVNDKRQVKDNNKHTFMISKI